MPHRLLKRGHYLGATLRQRSTPGLLLTLASYEPGRKWGRHVHEHPGFFFLLSGDHRETREADVAEQRVVTTIYHGTSDSHSTEVGPSGMIGLNISFESNWLASMGVKPRELRWHFHDQIGGQPFEALRVLGFGFKLDVADADVESAALELLVPLTAGNEPSPPGWLLRVRDTLHDRFEEQVSLRDLAAEAAIHPNYLARVFRRHFRCSVQEYLQRIRLTEAMRLIQQGTSLGAAAAQTGFSDQAHLTRLSSRNFGNPPGSIRSIAALS